MADKDLRKQCKELQLKLDTLVRERDELLRDLENLCFLSDAGSTTFNSSSVLQERIYSTEKELAQHKSQLAAVTNERDSLREDLREVTGAKRLAEQGYKQQLERAAALDKELAFYQAQSARVMADRDRAVWEGEELKAQNLQLEQQLREASSLAKTEAAQRAQMQQQLAEVREQLAKATAKALDAEQLPELRRQLHNAKAEVGRLQQREKHLEGLVRQLREELVTAQDSAAKAAAGTLGLQRHMDELAAAHAVVQQQLRGEVEQLQEEVEGLRTKLEAAEAEAEEARSAQAAAEDLAQLRKEEGEAALRRVAGEHEEELSALQAQLEEQQEAAAAAQQQVEEATQQKVAALVRVAEAEGGKNKAGNRIAHLTQELALVREQLEEAKQQKLTALMRMAELQQQQGGGAGSPTRSDSAKSDASALSKGTSKHSSPMPSPQKKGGGWWGSSPKEAATS